MTIRHEIIPSRDPRLKRRVRHDSRSLAYPFIARPEGGLAAVRHERYVPVFDQGQIGDCTANAALGALGTGELYLALSDFISGDRAGFDAPAFDQSAPDGCTGVYHDETVIDGFPGTYPPDDTGSDGLSAATVLKTRGWISGYTHVLNGALGLANALQTGPVIIGVQWRDSFETPDADGLVTITEDSSVVGGHELCVDEYSPDNGGMFGLTNSWGTSWGLDGRFYIDVTDMNTLLSSAEGGDATVFVPLNELAPTPITDAPLARLLAKESHWLTSAFPAYGAKGAQREVNRYLAAISQGR